MRMLWLLLAIANALVLFVLGIGLFAQLGNDTSVGGYVVFIGVIIVFVLLQILFIKKFKTLNEIHRDNKSKEKQRRKDEQYKKEREVPGSKARINDLNADICITGKHMDGLPISEGAEVHLYRCPDKVIFERNNNTYELDLIKISDITIKTDIEIQKSYVSSVGGAVGGYVLFGPLGAMIGGRAKERKSETVEEYLIFSYKKENNDEISYISFEVTGQRNAPLFINLLDNIQSDKRTIQL
ncbi:hypothetical protein [Cytobacillus gottheilii]|uniref:Uncharacterized protein n=1 Tax=Cytobacillus gottheilii TaxID=859144 RepID=A0ABX8F925_9BACI|nr:hypothetical protein [Cytobacillus gottheilii]QVY60928.1 hypothetical protein J1899_18445 [Cytobacillus gottheilii]